MPRPRNPANEAHRAEQERYRDRLKAARKPEAPLVDRAIAAAFALALSRLREAGQSNPVLEEVVTDSKALLLKDGYAPNEAVRKLMARLLYRGDLRSLEKRTAELTKRRFSPHYSSVEKRISTSSRSDEGDVR
ncbi:hypothetical protein [Agrobacterium pusense]|uniref:hypothetical protein n=1 Tax=Agrobacterium pusense TaxID=648995 RepID=UPI002F3F6EE1